MGAWAGRTFGQHFVLRIIYWTDTGFPPCEALASEAPQGLQVQGGRRRCLCWSNEEVRGELRAIAGPRAMGRFHGAAEHILETSSPPVPKGHGARHGNGCWFLFKTLFVRFLNSCSFTHSTNICLRQGRAWHVRRTVKGPVWSAPERRQKATGNVVRGQRDLACKTW